VPNFTVPAAFLTPAPGGTPATKKHHHNKKKTSTNVEKTPVTPAPPMPTSLPADPDPSATPAAKPSNKPTPKVPSVPTALPSTGITPLDQGLSQAQALTQCLTGPLGTTIKLLVPNVTSLNLTGLLGALQNLPLLGGPKAATQLQTCVTDAMKS
jgi:hypothetical protein